MIKGQHIPRLSIITVVLNDAEGLDFTLKSIFNQCFTDRELIVIDGGSADNTRNIIDKYADKINYLVSEPDKGIYDAMNKGIRLANGNYLNFLNAGDTYLNENTLSEVFLYESDIIYGDIYICEHGTNTGIYQSAHEFNLKTLLSIGTGVVCHQAFFIRRELAPLYDIQWKFKAELNWYFDILESRPGISCLHLPLAVINYQIGGKGYTYFWKNQKEWIKLVLKRYGWISFFRYNYPWKLILKMTYRYPYLLAFIKRQKN